MYVVELYVCDAVNDRQTLIRVQGRVAAGRATDATKVLIGIVAVLAPQVAMVCHLPK